MKKLSETGKNKMGAIIRLYSMPSKCSECPFADCDVTHCRLRNAKIIAGKKRLSRMPLCPLRDEGEYLASFLRTQ